MPNACGAVEGFFNRLRTLRSVGPCRLVSLHAGGVPQLGRVISPFAGVVTVIAGLVTLIAGLVTLIAGVVTLIGGHVTFFRSLISLVRGFVSLVGGVIPVFAGLVPLVCCLVSLFRTGSGRRPQGGSPSPHQVLLLAKMHSSD